MTLADFFESIPKFFSRLLFPVYVEDCNGSLFEVERLDFRNGCLGVVLEVPQLNKDQWDTELLELRENINSAWRDADYSSDAHKVFDRTANVISIERAYALLTKAETLLNAMYDD